MNKIYTEKKGCSDPLRIQFGNVERTDTRNMAL